MADKRRAIDGRTAFVSGAASGIGRAVAIRLARHGCPIAIIDQDAEGLEETAAQVSGPVLARTVDVRDRHAQMAFAAEVADWAPTPLGMVFNNAGVCSLGTVADATIEDDEWVVAINVGGVVNGTRAFLPILQRQGSGVIVNTSSVFGLVGVPAQSAYCASKFAVRGFTDALRRELRGTGVSAVTVHPGGIRTNIVRNARFHTHPLGPDVTRDQAVADFDKLAFTTPEKAAKVIHAGVKAGRSRVLIGADAYLFDLTGRLAPTRYWDLLLKLERFLPQAD